MAKQQTTGRTNIFIRYFILFAVIIALSLSVLGISLMTFLSNYWQTERTTLLRENTYSVAVTVRRLLSEEEFDSNYSPSKLVVASNLNVVSNSINADVFITDTNGHVILCQDRANAGPLEFSHCAHHDAYEFGSDILTQIDAQEEGEESLILREWLDGSLQYLVGEPIVINGTTTGYVIATTPIRGSNSFVSDVMQMFLLSAIAACLLAFVGAYFLSYRMLRPLHQMSKAVKQFSEGDFSYRVQVQGNDELSDLAQAFNEMALALATLEGSRRSFVANVSHELKTPMTTISGFIDGILDGTIPQEKQSYYLGIVSDEVKRLSRLVVAMLNMSKIETGDFQVKKREYDISEQIFRVLLTFEQKINEKHLDIVGMDQLGSVVVNADADIIYQVIYNLVDNAVKFTNEDGYISLSAVREDTRVVVRIKNSGAGIAPEELPKIFERFYKVDRSRSLDVKGSGLGLYLVKNMIELHGGQITVFSTENESTEFVFWLPNKERGNSDE